MSRTRKLPEKSKSEILRSVLYRNFLHEKPRMDFEHYYNEKMDTIIKHFKSKLK